MDVHKDLEMVAIQLFLMVRWLPAIQWFMIMLIFTQAIQLPG